MCKRASLIWQIDEDAVRWENGSAIPAGPNAGKFDPGYLINAAGLYADVIAKKYGFSKNT